METTNRIPRHEIPAIRRKQARSLERLAPGLRVEWRGGHGFECFLKGSGTSFFIHGKKKGAGSLEDQIEAQLKRLEVQPKQLDF